MIRQTEVVCDWNSVKKTQKTSLPASVKSFLTLVMLNTLRLMRKSATTPDRVENNQAPRYGRADSTLFCRGKFEMILKSPYTGPLSHTLN